METWTFSDKLQGLAGASAPIIAGLFGIQIYEYLSAILSPGNSSAIFWPVAMSCVVYVIIMSVAGFSLLMALERRFGQRIDASHPAMLTLAFGFVLGILLMLHRVAFVIIPA